MKKHFQLFALSLLFLFIPGILSTALACSCRSGDSVCEAFGGSQAVFIGEVTGMNEIEVSSSSDGDFWEPRKFEFKVSEAFTGAGAGKTVTVATGRGGGDCGFDFKIGETYLVFASGNNGKLVTSICSKTRLLANAEKDSLDFLRDLKNQSPGGNLSGAVGYYAKDAAGKNSWERMRNFTLELEQLDGDKQVRKIKTDEKGKFEVTDLPTGEYQFLQLTSKQFQIWDYDLRPFRLNSRGCADNLVLLESQNKVSGKIIAANGEPITDAPIELIPANIESNSEDEEETSGKTDENGEFEFSNIPSGQYLLTFNYLRQPTESLPFETYFFSGGKDRSKATPFTVEPATQIQDVVVQLPKALATREIHGKVIWKNGKPAKNVSITLRDSESEDFISDTKTDQTGNFVVKGFPGHIYTLETFVKEDVKGELVEFEAKDVEFTLKKNMSPFRLVLDKKKEDKAP